VLNQGGLEKEDPQALIRPWEGGEGGESSGLNAVWKRPDELRRRNDISHQQPSFLGGKILCCVLSAVGGEGSRVCS